jgi:hypothetical protein
MNKSNTEFVILALPDSRSVRLLQAWIVIHEEELMADWALAVKGEPVFPIDPLR